MTLIYKKNKNPYEISFKTFRGHIYIAYIKLNLQIICFSLLIKLEIYMS